MAKHLQQLTAAAPVAVATAQTALPFPPVAASLALVPAAWSSVGAGVVPEFDLALWAAAAVTLTNPTLYGARGHAFTYADNDITTVTHGSDLFTKVAHGLLHGDGPIQFTTADTLPAGLELATDYWVIYVNADTFKVATTRALALEGTVHPITDDGTGTHTVVDTADTQRVHWHSLGVIEASMVLGPQAAYTVPVAHDPLTIAYAVGATLGGAVATSIDMTPRMER
jgi:hypothetical protein